MDAISQIALDTVARTLLELDVFIDQGEVVLSAA
jgi:hypothetical protein